MITEIEQNRTERLRKMELRIEKAGLSARKPKHRKPQKATESRMDEIPLQVFLIDMIDCFFLNAWRRFFLVGGWRSVCSSLFW